MKLTAIQELGAIPLLKNLPLFAGCPEPALQAIIQVLDAREVPGSKVFLMDQEIARTLFILVKGSVTVWKRVKGEKVQLATLKAPDFFGERSMFEEAPATAMVKSESACVVYALEREQFEKIAVKFPTILEPIKKNMAAVREKRMGPTPPTPPPGGESGV
jgi:CRP-like cAMP-binding protein